jgi:hypothetical protein
VPMSHPTMAGRVKLQDADDVEAPVVISLSGFCPAVTNDANMELKFTNVGNPLELRTAFICEMIPANTGDDNEVPAAPSSVPLTYKGRRDATAATSGYNLAERLKFVGSAAPTTLK